MKGTFRNSFDFAVCLTKESLVELDNFLKSHYKQVKYNFSTIDNIDYNCESVEDVLNYKNSDQSKIQKMTIMAYHKENSFCDDFILTITQSNELLKKTIHYEIRNEYEKDLVFLKTKLNEFCNGLKSSNSWMYSLWFMYFCELPVSILLVTSLSEILKSYGVNTSILYVILIALSSILGMLFANFWSNLINLLFPTSYFCTGEQNKQNQVSQGRKAIILSILSSLVASWIFWLITK